MKCDITKLMCKTLCVAVALLLAACGGSVGSSGSKSPGGSYAVGGRVTGLSGSVVLQNNLGDNLTVTGNVAFTFVTPVASGSAYSVTVLVQPTGQTCSVANDKGTITGAAVINVGVSCISNTVPPPSATVRYIGGQLPELATWTPPIYANALKQGKPWAAASGGVAALDAQGNPTEDANLLFLAGSTPGPSAVVAGTYKLGFNGQATVGMGGTGTATVQNVSYDAATNTTTADVIIPSAGPVYIVYFSNSWRKADHTADATGNTRGITNARLMAPGHVWPTDYWRKEVVSMHNAFGLMRLQAVLGPGEGAYSASGNRTGTIGNSDTTWSTRGRPGIYGYTAKGMPWEDVVLFANLTGMDVWINTPMNADDDYLTKMFQLLRYGSDGNLPYTTQTHDPSTWTPANTSWYPGLLPGRKVYVEFNNELFTYWSYGDPQGAAELTAGDPHHLLWDNDANNFQFPGDRWGAWQTVRNSLLARRVWGDAAMGDTIRIVYANQGDWGNWYRHQRGLDYIVGVWGAGAGPAHDTIGGFTNPRQPVSYYIHNVSGSFYVHAYNSGGVPTATTVGNLLTQMRTSLTTNGGLGNTGGVWESNSVYERHLYGETLAAKYGIKFSSYETGIEVFQPGSVGAAWSDPGMQTLYYDLLTHMLALPHADVAVQSATVRGVAWTNELSRSYSSADGFPWPLTGTATPTPVWQAVMDVAAGK